MGDFFFWYIGYVLWVSRVSRVNTYSVDFLMSNASLIGGACGLDLIS